MIILDKLCPKNYYSSQDEQYVCQMGVIHYKYLLADVRDSFPAKGCCWTIGFFEILIAENT